MKAKFTITNSKKFNDFYNETLAYYIDEQRGYYATYAPYSPCVKLYGYPGLTCHDENGRDMDTWKGGLNETQERIIEVEEFRWTTCRGNTVLFKKKEQSITLKGKRHSFHDNTELSFVREWIEENLDISELIEYDSHDKGMAWNEVNDGIIIYLKTYEGFNHKVNLGRFDDIKTITLKQISGDELIEVSYFSGDKKTFDPYSNMREYYREEGEWLLLGEDKDGNFVYDIPDRMLMP